MRLISAQALRQYMEHRGLTVRALAHMAGVSRGTIGWLTSGQRDTTRTDTARKIADTLGCPVNALFAPIADTGTHASTRAA